ncbi:MAG: SDR family oxidoreductase, partial [Caulobacterales bacterium]
MSASIPHMKPGSRIITIGSNVAVRTGLPGYAVYTLTKGALAAFVRAASIDLAPLKITINNVQPGPTATDMLGTVTEVIEAVKAWVPVGRLAEPAEIASVVAFVASGETDFMTGSTIPIDGGSVA